MNQVATTFVGLALFIFQLIVAMYVLRTLAVKLHDNPIGQGLASLIY